jgi:hypothetical protein
MIYGQSAFQQCYSTTVAFWGNLLDGAPGAVVAIGTFLIEACAPAVPFFAGLGLSSSQTRVSCKR